MRKEGNGQPIRYRIDLSSEVAQQIQELADRAAAKGLLARFKPAFSQALHRLRTDPMNFGEGRYTLKNLGLRIRIAVARPVVIHFAVNENERFVLIQRVLLLES